MISITPITISKTIIKTENPTENLSRNGNKSAEKLKNDPLAVSSNSLKYSSILKAVPIGSTAFTRPENINKPPQKFCKKLSGKDFTVPLILDIKKVRINAATAMYKQRLILCKLWFSILYLT